MLEVLLGSIKRKMKITLDIKNSENIGALDQQKLEEIVTALLTSGGLTGVKGGKTILHFDSDGNFQKIQLDYYPWQRRSLK